MKSTPMKKTVISYQLFKKLNDVFKLLMRTFTLKTVGQLICMGLCLIDIGYCQHINHCLIKTTCILCAGIHSHQYLKYIIIDICIVYHLQYYRFYNIQLCTIKQCSHSQIYVILCKFH